MYEEIKAEKEKEIEINIKELTKLVRIIYTLYYPPIGKPEHCDSWEAEHIKLINQIKSFYLPDITISNTQFNCFISHLRITLFLFNGTDKCKTDDDRCVFLSSVCYLVHNCCIRAGVDSKTAHALSNIVDKLVMLIGLCESAPIAYVVVEEVIYDILCTLGFKVIYNLK